MQRIRVHLEVLEPSGVELSRRQLDVGRHRLGRGADCEVRAPLNGLSREHVLLEVLPSGGVLIEDLGSTNGTRIDGLAVQRAAVRHGATLQAGPLLLRIRDALEAAPTNAVVALVGIGSIYPFLRASSVIKSVDSAVTGRLLVLFPGLHDPETHSFRLLDARDGFNYRARVIDPQKDIS